jgi:hypothetical protein
MLVVATMVLATRLRTCFGAGFKVPLMPFEVPASLFLLGGGMATIATAGLLDDAWHSSFGLDETAWSTPHSMLAWGYFVTILGFTSARLSLRAARPLSGLTWLVYGFLVLGAALGAILGPLGNNNTPETVRAVSAIPVLAAQPAAQHTYAIYLAWNVDRTHPMFGPVAAFASGAGLALVRGLTRRADYFALVAFSSSVLTMFGDRNSARFLDVSGDPANWLPLPIVPAALVFAWLVGKGIPQARAWVAAGVLFGLLTLLVWGSGPVAAAAALAAGPMMWGGAVVGARIFKVVEAPTRKDLSWAVPLLGVGMPLLTGAVDLYLRVATAWPT